MMDLATPHERQPAHQQPVDNTSPLFVGFFYC
jgi:hypothetical protein